MTKKGWCGVHNFHDCPHCMILELEAKNAQLKHQIQNLDRAEAEATEQKVAKYEKALKEISTMGRVCEGFELCTHVACADSCGSTLIALEALKEVKP